MPFVRYLPHSAQISRNTSHSFGIGCHGNQTSETLIEMEQPVTNIDSTTTPDANVIHSINHISNPRDIIAHITLKTTGMVPPPIRKLSEAVAKGITYMAAEHPNELSISAVASNTGLSRFHFTRKFRSETGISPGEFLRRLRITRAMEILVGSQQRIQKIAKEVGYQDHAAFTRAFGRVLGVRPREYRNKQQSAAALA